MKLFLDSIFLLFLREREKTNFSGKNALVQKCSLSKIKLLPDFPSIYSSLPRTDQNVGDDHSSSKRKDHDRKILGGKVSSLAEPIIISNFFDLVEKQVVGQPTTCRRLRREKERVCR